MVLQFNVKYAILPIVTRILAPVFSKNYIEFGPKSSATMKSLLNSYKNSIPFLKKSGIYEFSCHSNCNAEYYGKTIKTNETKFSEHMYLFKCINSDKSGVAKHKFENQHTIEI